MGLPWGKVFSIGMGVLEVVLPGVRSVEVIARNLPTLRGKAKQDAVVEMVKHSLELGESLIGRDLANDADVERATRGVIDAVVALNNIVAQKAQTAT